MELTKNLRPEQIILGLEVRDKWELLDRMIEVLFTSHVLHGASAEMRARVRQAVLEREKAGATVLGEGVLFPHGRVAGLKDFALCLAVLKKGLELAESPGAAVHTVCMVVSPEENPMLSLRVTAAIAELLADPGVREYFRSEDDPRRLYEYLRRHFISVSPLVTAKHLMRPVILSVRRKTPLREVTWGMVHHRLEALPVLEEDGTIVGEITCDLLFRHGVPGFFGELASVSFIREFDPFQKYFMEEAKLVAEDVMSTEPPCIGEDATPLEIVYELSVRNYAKLYVVKERRLVGIVDRTVVLHRILAL